MQTYNHPRYLYDMRIPSGVDPAIFEPKPLDGEVESFEVCSLRSGLLY